MAEKTVNSSMGSGTGKNAAAHHVAPLTVREKVGYGLGDLASNLFWQMFAIFMAKFYTDVFLLGAATMGTMFLVTRMFDAVTDPLMGSIADRTHTRWGHFRPYLVWLSVPLALSAVLAFTTPSFEGTAKIVYAYLTMSLMMLMYTAINIPYSALLGVLTPDSDDRTSASSYRFVMALLPVFIIVNTAIPLVEFFGDGSSVSPRGWQLTMVCYASLAVLLFLATFAMTKERVQPPAEQKSDLRTDVRNLFRNRPWIVLCIVGISALTYANIRGTVAIYYFEYVMTGGKDLFGPVMTTGAAAFIAGVMITSPMSKRFGKRNFYLAAMMLTAVLTVAFYFVPPDNVPLVWTMHALISFVAAPTAPLVWAMYADTADFSEWKWGRRATGLVFSAASFAQKLGWAIGGAGTGWLLAYFGYMPNVQQSPETVNGIKLMMSFIPTVGALIAIAALFFYDLDETKVKQIGLDLEVRRAQEDVPAHAPTPATTPAMAASSSSASETAMTAASLTPSAQPSVQPSAPPSVPPSFPPSFPQSVPPSAPQSAPKTPAFAGAATRLQDPPLSPAQQADLTSEFRAVLDAGVHGLCFSPYAPGQAPGTQISEAQIRERLTLIAPHTRWIRSFSCTDGHEQTPRIARELGLKTLVCAWLGTDPAINEREIEGLIAVARAGHADIVAVGNEVLLREDLNEDVLLAHIQRVKEAVPDVTLGYVDAYYLFEQHPRVTAACDVILANCYPFWEGCPREQAVAYMASMIERVRAVAGGKRIVVSETGWPDQGSAFHAAVPSQAGAMRYFVDTHGWAQAAGIETFYFAAFDEAWKVGAEGDVGACWGLWDSSGKPKFT